MLSIFTLLCNKSPELFPSCKTETLYPLNNNSHLLSPSLWQPPFHFLSLWIWLCRKGREGKSEILLFPVCLYLTQHDGLRIHPCGRPCRNCLPCHGRTTFRPVDRPHLVYPAHPLMNFWVRLHLWPLWRVLLWTAAYRYLLASLTSILSEVEFLDSTIILCLGFWENAKLFSRVAAPSLIPTNNAQGFISLHLVQHSLKFFH